MIVSPRANEVTDIVRIVGKCLIEIDRVILYRRGNDGNWYPDGDFWNRDDDNSEVATGGGQCRCDHKPCVIIAETDYDTENQTFDPIARVLNGEGNFSGETIHLDHIILEMEASNSE